MRPLRRLFVLPALALLATSLSADTLFVPGNAATLSEAADLAQPGDRIVLRGAQPLGGTVLNDLTDIEILGKDGALLDAAGDDYALALSGCSGVRVRGLRLANSASHGLFAVACDELDIERVRIDHAGFVGLLLSNCHGVRITRLRVESSSGPSVSASESTDVELTRSQLNDSGGNGVLLFDARRVLVDRVRVTDSAGHGLFADDSLELEITRNRFLRPGGSGVILDGNQQASLVRDNLVRAGNLDGISVSGSTTVVERNRIRDVQGFGLRLSGPADANLQSRDNRIRNTVGNGLELTTSDQGSEGDRVRAVGGHGALVHGDGLNLTDLRVTQCALDGVHVQPAVAPFFNSANVFDHVQVRKAGGHGFAVEQGTGTMLVSDCRVSGAQGHGMLLEDAGGTYDDNRVRGAGENGIDVSSGNNLFRDNKVNGSSGLDLNDHPPSGQSNFFLGNDFGTGDPAPL
ncbi:MAG: hypothetical protein DHS20C15_18880 [Planctomycetota bacterium]|nr:MAG: hypothetical protein DHS20C15_18880 [Planctomycetota bacterium]